MVGGLHIPSSVCSHRSTYLTGTNVRGTKVARNPTKLSSFVKHHAFINPVAPPCIMSYSHPDPEKWSMHSVFAELTTQVCYLGENVLVMNLIRLGVLCLPYARYAFRWNFLNLRRVQTYLVSVRKTCHVTAAGDSACNYLHSLPVWLSACP